MSHQNLKLMSLIFFTKFTDGRKYILMGKYSNDKRLEGFRNGYGGKCKVGENTLECARREVEEEFGVIFDKEKFIKVGKLFDQEIQVDIFIIVSGGDFVIPANNSEFEDVRWFDIEKSEVFLNEMLNGDNEIIPKLSEALEQIKNNVEMVKEFEVELSSNTQEEKKEREKIKNKIFK